MKENEQLALECDCGAHYLTVTYWAPWQDEPPVAYLAVHTTRMPLWWRIKEAVKLIFNKDRTWEEFVFENFRNLDKLKRMVLKLEENFKEWEKYKEAGSKSDNLIVSEGT
jgi:hypothetical protein